jgi:hypothetical protein
MSSSLLWLSCRSALVARPVLAPIRRRVLPSGHFASMPADMRVVGVRRFPRSLGVPAAAAFRCRVPGARPGSLAARD